MDSVPVSSPPARPLGRAVFAAGVAVFAVTRAVALARMPQTVPSAALVLAALCALVACALPVLLAAARARPLPGDARTFGLAALGVALCLAASAPGVHA